MREILRQICDLQLRYSSKNTPEMHERGLLIRQRLPEEIRALRPVLARALGPFGDSFHVDASDGIGNKTELPWVRFCSQAMSPSATEGYYVVLHFSTDGSAVNVAVGCSSSKFHNGYSVLLPRAELAQRTEWVKRIVREERGTLEPFTDPNDFGARLPLPKSFEAASALVKKIPYDEIEDTRVVEHLVQAAEILSAIYSAQRMGVELSPADQAELDILRITKPSSNVVRGQGFGLTAQERKAVELRAMTIALDWLNQNGYSTRDTSSNRPYDFEARLGDEVLLVEVKGTTSGSSDTIMMTHTEVDLHRRERGKTALMLVSGIRLQDIDGDAKALGGELEALVGWNVDEWVLQPTTFRLSRGTAK